MNPTTVSSLTFQIFVSVREFKVTLGSHLAKMRPIVLGFVPLKKTPKGIAGAYSKTLQGVSIPLRDQDPLPIDERVN